MRPTCGGATPRTNLLITRDKVIKMTAETIRNGLRDYAEISQQLTDLLATPEGARIKECMDALEAKKKEVCDLAKAEGAGLRVLTY